MKTMISLDLSLTNERISPNAVVQIGDQITFKICVQNVQNLLATAVTVRDTIPAGAGFVSFTATQGTYDPLTGIWNIGDIAATTSEVCLELTLSATGEGVIFNLAEIFSSSDTDTDSTPNNGILTEDDIASACVSVPMSLSGCAADTIVLTAPAGHTNYKWYKNGNEIAGATTNVYMAGDPGSYTFSTELLPSGCASGSCCPVVIVETACLGNFVWYDNNGDGDQDLDEDGVPDVSMQLWWVGADGVKGGIDDELEGTEITDANGIYNFTDIPAGSYYVMLDLGTLPLNYEITTPDNAADVVDSDATPAGMTNPTTLDPGENDGSIDFGIKPLPASLGNYVWLDEDGDGDQDGTENGIPDIPVTLFDLGPNGVKGGGDDNIIATQNTGAMGNYYFSGLAPGSYYVMFDLSGLPAGQTVSPQNAGGVDGAFNSDANAMGMTNVVVLGPGQANPDIDMGIVPAPCNLALSANITGAACGVSNGSIDLDISGGQPNYIILWSNGATTEDLTGIPAGMYLVTVTDMNGCSKTANYALNNANGPTASWTFANSKCNTPTGSIDVTVTGGVPTIGYLWNDGATSQDRSNLAAGMYSLTITDGNGCQFFLMQEVLAPCGSVGNFVWFDHNGNGQQDGGLESGVPGVSVTLFEDPDGIKGNADDIQVGFPAETNGSGNYLFPNLDPSNYYVVFNYATLPGGWQPTQQNNGDNNTDSDADELMGMTQSFPLAAGQNDRSWDLGIEPKPASVGNFVWIDTNGNGIQDPLETTGVPGIDVALYSTGPDGDKGTADDVFIGNDVTDGNGESGFAGLAPGEYYVQFDVNDIPAGHSLTGANANFNNSDAADSDANLMGMTVEFMLSPGEDDPTWDMGIVPQPVSVGDFVWFDENGNGQQDGGENGVPNMTVTLYSTGPDAIKGNGNDVLIATDLTDGNGEYGFTGLPASIYYVVFDLAGIPSGYQLTTQNAAGTNETNDSDANAMGMTDAVTLVPGQAYPDFDMGVSPVPTFAAIGNFVWYDLNQNGLQDGGAETGVVNVEVYLFNTVDGIKGNADDIFAGSDITDIFGEYGFTGLTPGQYYVQFNPGSLPNGYQLTGQDANANASDGIDSDVNAMGMTVATDLAGGETDLSWDAGIFQAVFDLALTKKLATGQSATVAPGDLVHYEIKVLNQGMQAATNIYVTDYVPLGLQFLAGNNPGWSYDAGTRKAYHLINGPLTVGNSQSILMNLVVEPASSGAIVNAAEISDADNDFNVNNPKPSDTDSSPDATDGDPVGGNDVTDNTNGDEDDHDPETITVVQPVVVDLALQKKLAAGQSVFINPGDFVNFSITVINQGAVNVANVKIIDYLDANTVLADADWTSTGPLTATYVWPGTILAGGQASVDITVQYLPQPNVVGAAVINFAEILEATDPGGNPVTDIDSDRNDDKNDDIVAGPIDEIDNTGDDEDDHDYEIVIDLPKYDPIGFIYCDKTGKIITGGTITITPPAGGAAYYVNGLDGSTGIYQFYTDGTPGDYTMTFSHPNGYPISATCPAQPGAFDPTGMDGFPGVDADGMVDGFVTFGSDTTANGMFVSDPSCAANPYYLVFDLDDAGDPEVRHNNIPVSCVLIASIVCEDTNANDLIDAGDTPISGATVYLYDCSDLINPIDSTVSDALGQYSFDGLEAGDYVVGYDVSDPAIRPVINGPIDSDGFSDCISLDWGECDTTTIICLYSCPEIDAGKDEILCLGDSVQLQMTGYTGLNFAWNFDPTLSDPTLANPVATPLATTIYTVSYNDQFGCADSDDMEVTVLCTPDISLVSSEPATSCVTPDGQIFISASSNNDCDIEFSIDGGATYQASSFFDDVMAGDYVIAVRSEDGCIVYDSVTVDGPNPPQLLVAPTVILMCQDDLVEVYFEIDQLIGDVTINGTAGYTPPDITGNSFTFVATLNGLFETFEVTIETIDGCTVEHTFYLLRISEPESDFVVIEPACDNDVTCFKFTGTASTSAILNWNVADGTIVSSSPATLTDPAGANICVTFPTPGFRMIMLMVDDGGCEDIHTEGVNIKKAPKAFAGPDKTICLGDCTTLSGTTIGGIACWWEPAAPLSSWVPACDTTVCPTDTTLFVYWVCDANGCKDSDTVQVNVIEIIANAGPDQEVCLGFCATLTASGGTSYLWSTTATTASINVCPTATTTYYVTVTGTNGCTDVDSVQVIVHPNPIADAGPDQEICLDKCATLMVTGLPLTSTFTYLWSNSGTMAATNVCPTVTTTWYVTITDQNGCTDVDSVKVIVLPLPTANAGPDVAICTGFCTNLTASGGVSYEWSTGGLTATIQVCPLVTTTYTVTVTDAKGCTDTDQVTVTVNSNTADAGPDGTICENGCFMLVATGSPNPVGYAWSNGVNVQMNNVCPLVTTTYTVTVTDANGCTDTDQATVFVNPNPNAQAWPDTVLCGPGCVILHASGGVSYGWFPNTGLNNPSLQNPKACVTTTTTYVVLVTDINGCNDTAQVTIFVNPFNGSAGPDQAVCPGQCATLTATPGVAWLWSTSATTATISVCPAVTTTYSVTITGPNGCTDVDEVVVTVYPSPPANAGHDEIICAGNCTNLAASGGVAYAWSTGQFGSVISVCPTVTTTYTVTVTSAQGCTATDQVVVTVLPLPTANAGPDQTICNGSCTNLTASGGVSYAWSNGQNLPTINVCPTTTTTYTVTVTGANGCTATDQVTVTVQPLPTANAGPDQFVCAGNCAILTATGGGTYAWSTGETTNQITVCPSTAITYTVTVTGPTGCKATDQVTVFVNPNPTATINPGDVQICEGSCIMLMAGGGVTYAWGPAAGLSSTNTAMTLACPTVTTTYVVTVTDANGCTDTEDIVILVKPGPDADAGPDQSICAGQCATLTATGGTSYSWSNGASTATTSVCPTVPTVYQVTVYASNGCSATDFVLVNTNGGIIPTAGPNQSVCAGQSATITATGGGTYLWSNGETTASINVTPAVSTTYTVTVTTANGCTGSASATITVNPLPTANAGPDQSICAGSSATLNATGGGTYSWSNGGNTASINVSPAVSTTYTVTVTSGAGCTATDQVTVTVNPQPTANAGPDVTICQNGSATLTATGGGTYAWSNGGNTASINVSPAVTTTYTVTVTGAGGCTATDQVTVTVNSGGEFANAGPDVAICGGSSTTLNATGGTSYIWSNGATTASTSVSPATTTTYTVTATNANGCTDTDDVIVTVNQPPTANAGADKTYCVATPVTLTATGGSSYAWSTGQNGQTISVQVNATTTFVVTVTDVNGCTDTDDIVIFIENSLTVNGNVSPAQCGDTNGMIELTVTGGSGSYSFVWSPNVSTTANAFDIAGGNYSVTVTDLISGCTKTATFNVPDLAGPSVTLTATAGTCNTEGSITVSISGGTAPYNVQWAGPENGSQLNATSPFTIPNLTAGSYSVTVSDNAGCTNVQTIQVQQSNSNISILANNTAPASCTGAATGIISIIVNGAAAPWSITINGSPAASNVNSNPTALNGYAAGVYAIGVTDANGCTATGSVTVTQTPPPTLTPNDLILVNPTCFGVNNGSISSVMMTVTVWKNGFNIGTAPVTGLAAGLYTVRKSQNGCDVNLDVTLISPTEVVLTLTPTNANCCGNNGSIVSNTTGGTPGYTYEWSNGATTANISGLVPGFYILTVTDSHGCTDWNITDIFKDCDDCQDIVAIDSVGGTAGDSIAVCLPLTQTALDYYDILVDGQVYLGSYHGCAEDSIVAYPMAAVIANGGPVYNLNSWICNNLTLTNKLFSTFTALADTMNLYDPTGNWAYDNVAVAIVGGDLNASNIYGQMLITSMQTGLQSTVNASYTEIALGTEIQVPGTEGKHTIVLIDPVNCCRDTICVYVAPAVDPVNTTPETITLNTPYETALSNLCLNLSELTGAVSGNVTFCDAANFGTLAFNGTCFNYQPNAGFTGQDNFCLSVCDVNGVCDTTYYIINVGLPPCPDFVSETIFNVALAACNLQGTVCIDIPNSEILTWSITDNGSPYLGGYGGCDFDTTYNYSTSTIPGGGNSGPYSVNWVFNSLNHNGTFNNIAGLVAFMNAQNPGGNWTFNAGLQVIEGGINGTNYGAMDISGAGGMAHIEVNQDFTPNGTQLNFAVGEHEVVFTKNGCTDLLTVNVTCPNLPDTVLNFTIQTNETDSYCLGALISNGATITSITNNCPQNSGDVTFTINPQTTCVSFYGIQEGTGQACLSVCLTSGQCFNVTLNVIVTPDVFGGCEIVADESIAIDLGSCNTPHGTFCVDIPFATILNFDIFLDGAPFAGASSSCNYNGGPNGSGTQLDLTVSGSHVFVFADKTNGNCTDTLLVEGFCFQISPDFLKATIYVADQDTVCLDISELPGTVFSTSNSCPAVNGFVLFEKVPGTLCYLCTGLEVGVENVCFVLCDDQGFCDTTYMEVTVLDRSLRIPVALMDCDTTLTNTPIVIPVLANDTVPGALVTMSIITHPLHGIAMRNPLDNSFLYTPNKDYCNEITPDEFTYTVCNALGCDTATVKILTLCDRLKIYTGFSPNGDGMNDVFLIEGIHNFPNNELTVFNRWGNRIYNKTKYDNTWDGTWNGEHLPDGTYFWIFDDGEGRSLSGYVHIQR